MTDIEDSDERPRSRNERRREKANVRKGIRRATKVVKISTIAIIASLNL